MHRSGFTVTEPSAPRVNVGQAKTPDALVDAPAGPLVDLHAPTNEAGLPALLPGQLQHAGMARDHDRKLVAPQGFLHESGELGLRVRVHLGDVLHSQPLQHLAHGDGLGDAVEVPARRGQLLVACHGRGAVLHEHEDNRMPVEQGIHDPGDSRVEEGGVPQEAHDLAGRVEQAHPRGDPRGGAHAHQELAHPVGRQVAQRVAADVRDGDVAPGQRLLHRVEGAPVAAARAHLRRPRGNLARTGRVARRPGRLPARREEVRPRVRQHLPHLVRRVLPDALLGRSPAPDPRGEPLVEGQGLDPLLEQGIELLDHLHLRVRPQEPAHKAPGERVHDAELQDVGPAPGPFQDVEHGQVRKARRDDSPRAVAVVVDPVHGRRSRHPPRRPPAGRAPGA